MISQYSACLQDTFKKRKKEPLLSENSSLQKGPSDLLKIIPFFDPDLQEAPLFSHYISFIENLVFELLPPQLMENLEKANSPQTIGRCFNSLDQNLPIITCFPLDKTPNTFRFILLCSADYTYGVGRYISDTLSRWMNPGKPLPLCAVHSLNFSFRARPKKSYFFHQSIMCVESDNDRETIIKNIEQIIHETRLNILSVSHARSIVALKTLSFDQKKLVIEENLASLLNRSTKEIKSSIFDQMHQFLLKLTSEDKIERIKKEFHSLINSKPNVSDKDIYCEVQHFIELFDEFFTAYRQPRHISRLIAFCYLFRKSILREIKQNPKKRQHSIKLFKSEIQTSLNKRPVLGILITLSLLQEHEVFEEKHAFEAVKHCLPNVIKIEGSLIIDRRDQHRMCLLYFEVEKSDQSSFELSELKQLRNKLPREIKERIENVMHPIFMPRNEEEIMRNILILSEQLQYVKDIPQAMISFENQSAKEIGFTIILLRLLSKKTTPLKEALQRAKSSVKFQEFEVKNVGIMRKKYIKEANVFTVKVDKKPFLRKDYSLDLYKARQIVMQEMCAVIGDIRDFNGGILSKQLEVFHALKNALSPLKIDNDFLLENYFYSLTPPLSRSILPLHILKDFFVMFSDVSEHDFKMKRYFYKERADEEFLLIVTATPFPIIREQIFSAVNKIELPSNNITFSFVDVYEFACLGYILRTEDSTQRSRLIQAIKHVLHSCNHLTSSPPPE